MAMIWCNGRVVDAGDFRIGSDDRGLTHGFGLFETLLAIDGSPVFAEDHLRRLRDSCAHFGWDPPLPDRTAIAALLAANGLQSGRARVRLAVSAGRGALNGTAAGADQTVWMSTHASPEPPSQVAVNLSPWPRNEHAALAGLKSACYAENLLALARAASEGCAETLFLNTAGQLCEAATANVFIVRDGVLLTPPPRSGCLPGLTRSRILRLAAALGISCHESDLFTHDLETADELFLSSSVRGLTAVSTLCGRPLRIGPVTTALRDAWWLEVRRNIGA